MSQFSPPDGGYAEPSARAGQTSKLAVSSLICSLIFCCPVTTILGVILGLAGVAVTGSGKALRGRGMAVAGLILGLVFTCVWVFGGNAFYKTFIAPVMAGPADAMVAGFAGDDAGFKSHFTGAGAAASDAEARAFIATLQDRYGAYQGMAFDKVRGQGQQPQPGQAQATFPYMITFASATVPADAEIIFADQATGQMVFKWTFIRVIDDDAGDVVYPPGHGGGGGGAFDGDADADADAEDQEHEHVEGVPHDHDGDGIPDH